METAQPEAWSMQHKPRHSLTSGRGAEKMLQRRVRWGKGKSGEEVTED